MSSILLIALLVAAWLLHKRYYHQLAAQGRAGKIKIALVIFGILFLALALTGRASPIFALIGAAMTQIMRLAPLLVRFAPSLARTFGSSFGPGGFAGMGGQPGADRTSRVNTRSVTMTLDQATGVLDGVVLQGKFKDRRLSELSIQELRDLYQSATSHDPEAARLLIAYASRERSEEWEAAGGPKADGGYDGHGNGDNAGGGPSARMPSGAVSIEEALEILGLPPNPDKQAIVDAHRALMSRMHPDRGGSHYFATKINLAKQVLLDALESA